MSWLDYGFLLFHFGALPLFALGALGALTENDRK